MPVSCCAKLSESKLFGSTCTLLVSVEGTREVVQRLVGPRKLVEACRVQHLFEPLASNKSTFDMASLYKLAGSTSILNQVGSTNGSVHNLGNRCIHDAWQPLAGRGGKPVLSLRAAHHLRHQVGMAAWPCMSNYVCNILASVYTTSLA